MLFMVAAMAAEMERELISERTLDGLAAAEAQGRKGGRPIAVDADILAVALAGGPAANPSPLSPTTWASAALPSTEHWSRTPPKTAARRRTEPQAEPGQRSVQPSKIIPIWVLSLRGLDPN